MKRKGSEEGWMERKRKRKKMCYVTANKMISHGCKTLALAEDAGLGEREKDTHTHTHTHTHTYTLMEPEILIFCCCKRHELSVALLCICNSYTCMCTLSVSLRPEQVACEPLPPPPLDSLLPAKTRCVLLSPPSPH